MMGLDKGGRGNLATAVQVSIDTAVHIARLAIWLGGEAMQW